MLTIDTPKKLPSVDRLANDPNNAFLVEEYGMPLVTQCVQTVLSEARRHILAGRTIEYASLVKLLSEETARAVQPSLRPVINLTGTVLHTNLGRAALPESAILALSLIHI